jgi:hypothetical protein
MRRLIHVERRDPDDFRLLRRVDDGVNFTRFTKHVTKLKRRLRNDPIIRKLSLQNRRRRRAAARATLAC